MIRVLSVTLSEDGGSASALVVETWSSAAVDVGTRRCKWRLETYTATNGYELARLDDGWRIVRLIEDPEHVRPPRAPCRPAA